MKNYYVTLSLCVLMLTVQQTAAQNEALVTDRPDQTEASSVVLKNSLQIESGLRYGTDKESALAPNMNFNTKRTTVDIESLFRYGLLENMELRLILGYRSFTTDLAGGSKITGLAPIVIGTKIAITEERGIIPEMAFIGHLNLSYFGAPAFRPEDIEPSFRFCFTHTLSDKLSLGYNLGMEWESAEESGIYTLVLGISLTDRLGMYIEQYGSIHGDFNLEASANGGLTYLLNNNLQVDLTGGLGLTKNADDAFVAFGFSWRLPRKS